MTITKVQMQMLCGASVALSVKLGNAEVEFCAPASMRGLFARCFAYVHQRCVKISEVFVVEIWQGTGCECLPENPFLQKKTLRSLLAT
jgi:hypothetical protein